MAKYFIDTEFIEHPHTIDLISIGIKCDNGEKFYMISSEFNGGMASKWVMDNVIRKLEPEVERHTKAFISGEVMRFIQECEGLPVQEGGGYFPATQFEWPEGKPKPQFYGYYASYDWVVFCWLFGSMIYLPKGFPMYPLDIQQMIVQFGIDKDKLKQAVPQTHQHNALADAEWNEKAFNYIRNEVKEKYDIIL